MSSRTTPMNLNQRTNEKMRKAYRSVRNKGKQKFTSLQRNNVQMRDRPNRMARNLKEKIVNLNLLMRGDSRVKTPLDRRPNDVRHDVV